MTEEEKKLLRSERRSGHLLLLAALTVVLTLVLNVVISFRLQRLADQRACATLGALILAYEETPPTTAAGRNVDDAYRAQYRLYDCRPPADPRTYPTPYGPPPAGR